MKKILLSSMVMISLIFSGCTLDDDDANIGGGDPGDITAQNLSGSLTADLRLQSGIEYTLTGALFVRSGATLSVDAGVTVKALAGGTDVYILVERGASIITDGTATSPITFTSSATNPQPGDWGGLIINGNAPLSRQGNAQSNAAAEVNNTVFFGGDNPADNSGILNYVIIEYTGARIDDEAEHNGLTLNGIGSGTTITNIAILNGDDDAIEFFGGSVNASNVLVVNARDDMFDFTQGYTGTCTNLYGVREAAYSAVTSDPRGVEADGNLDGNSPTDIDQSAFVINGLTIINNGTGVEMSDAIKVRRGAKVLITNSYVVLGLDATYSDFIDLEDAKGNATSDTEITAVGNAANGLDINDNKNAPGATLNISNGTVGFIDTSIFSWTGYNF